VCSNATRILVVGADGQFSPILGALYVGEELSSTPQIAQCLAAGATRAWLFSVARVSTNDRLSLRLHEQLARRAAERVRAISVTD
jgi:hypothetical protein